METRNPITLYEIREKMKSLELGQKMKLRQYNLLRESPAEALYHEEVCTIVGIYTDVVVFQRPNGMTCSRTGVELVMADRGMPI